jgi:hypothetical protein
MINLLGYQVGFSLLPLFLGGQANYDRDHQLDPIKKTSTIHLFKLITVSQATGYRFVVQNSRLTNLLENSLPDLVS